MSSSPARDAELPAASKGKVALAALGFTYDSRFAVEAWSKRFKGEFGGRPGVTFFEIPMIGGMGRLGKFFIDRGMRKNTATELHENVITVYGGTGDWKTRVGFKQEDAAYLLLIDAQGIVRWIHAGMFDEAAFQALRAATLALLDPAGSSAVE